MTNLVSQEKFFVVVPDVTQQMMQNGGRKWNRKAIDGKATCPNLTRDGRLSV